MSEEGVMREGGEGVEGVTREGGEEGEGVRSGE